MYTWTTLIAAMSAATVNNDVIAIQTNMDADMAAAGLAAGSVIAVDQWLDQIDNTSSFNKNFTLLNNAGSLFVLFMGLTPPVAPDIIPGDLVIDGLLTVTPPIATSGAVTTVTVNNAANTGQTVSTEVPSFVVNTTSRQWAAGPIPLQREVKITAPTYSFTAPSTIASAITLNVAAPIAGANATLTDKWAIGTNGNVLINTDLGGQMALRDVIGTISPGIYLSNAVPPTAINFTITSDGTTFTKINAPNWTSQLILTKGNTVAFVIYTGDQNATNFATQLNYNSIRTAITAGANAPQFVFDFVNQYEFATGAVVLNEAFQILTPTISAVAASVIAESFSFAVYEPSAGANITFTNNYAAGINGHAKITKHLNLGNLANVPTAFLGIAPGTAAEPQLNLGIGIAPVAPANGDIWFDGANLFMQVGGVSLKFTLAP